VSPLPQLNKVDMVDNVDGVGSTVKHFNKVNAVNKVSWLPGLRRRENRPLPTTHCPLHGLPGLALPDADGDSDPDAA
jgi:hypothetical protein